MGIASLILRLHILMIFFSFEVSSQTCSVKSAPKERPTKKFNKVNKSFLNGTVFHELHVKDAMECGLSCLQEDLCASYNMARKPSPGLRYICELLSIRIGDLGAELVKNDTFDHFSTKFHCYADNGRDASDFCVGTCRDIKLSHPPAPSGYYVIDPSGDLGEPPFPVFCDMMSHNGIGVTVVGHDSEARTHVNGYKGAGSYSRDITYNFTSVTQLKELTTRSSYCVQFIKYECKRSALYYYQGSSWYNWWVSRDGQKMTSWGGAPTGSNKCACGVTGTCANPAYRCNCSSNDGTWREDSGLLTDKDTLPVIQLRAGDTDGSTEEGYLTLGKLMCY
ncbi:contactin-associated protein-like 2 [Nematostella vectensis]|nr:contactin-associated protein-like 2 [Nematostella vectensis]